jgi:hypothetical protein
MAKYLVRKEFYLTLEVGNNKQFFEGGSEVELSPEQYHAVKHMVEVKPEPSAKEAK